MLGADGAGRGDAAGGGCCTGRARGTEGSTGNAFRTGGFVWPWEDAPAAHAIRSAQTIPLLRSRERDIGDASLRANIQNVHNIPVGAAFITADHHRLLWVQLNQSF